MGYRYIVAGPGQDLTKEFTEIQRDGHIPVIVKDETVLRGRVNGEIIFVGDVEKLWNYQAILESIEDFKELHKDSAIIPESDRPNDFFDYGVGE